MYLEHLITFLTHRFIALILTLLETQFDLASQLKVPNMSEEVDYEIDFYGDAGNEQQEQQQEQNQEQGGEQAARVNTAQDGAHDGGDDEQMQEDQQDQTHHEGDENGHAPQQGTKRKQEDEDDGRPVDAGATSAIMISDLNWWTTDDDIRGWLRKAEAEDEVKDVTFSEHKVNGKSKG